MKMSEIKNDPQAEELLQNAEKYPERAADPSDESDQTEKAFTDPEQTPPPKRNEYVAPQGLVYAGPTMPVAMVTYAGPGMMNSGMSFIFQSAPPMPVQPQPAVDPDGIICEICGNTNPGNSKFCTECGHQLEGTIYEKTNNKE